jgi:hypothetical protein
MADALTATPEGPQTDTLADQADVPKPQENQLPQDDAPSSTEDAVKKAMEKVAADQDENPKAEPKEEAKEKAEEEPKEEAKKDEPKAKKPPKEEVEQEAEADEEADDEAEDQKPRQTAFREPPKGFDDAAKKDWEQVPESVRGAMHRRQQEMESGINKYRQDAEQFDSVRKYAEMAQQSGTDLSSALERYVGMEQQLRQNPMQGLQQVVANLGLTKPDGTPVTLRDVAASIMGQTPDQAASQQEATINRLTQQVQSLTQQLGGFSQHIEHQKEQERVSSAANEWDSFQQDNPRAKELEPQIAEFLTKYPADNMPVRERLQDALKWAEAQNPSVPHTDSEPLVQTQPKPRQANPAGQKSISGAPGRSDAKSGARIMSTSDAVKKAMRQAGR